MPIQGISRWRERMRLDNPAASSFSSGQAIDDDEEMLADLRALRSFDSAPDAELPSGESPEDAEIAADLESLRLYAPAADRSFIPKKNPGIGALATDVVVGAATAPLVFAQDIAQLTRDRVGGSPFDPKNNFDPQAGPGGLTTKIIRGLDRLQSRMQLDPDTGKTSYFGSGFRRESVRGGLGQTGHGLAGRLAAGLVTMAEAIPSAIAGTNAAGGGDPRKKAIGAGVGFAVDPGFETRGEVMISGLPRAREGAGDEQAKAT